MKDSGTTSNHVVDHLFRHESGKLIAVLTRIFGTHQLEMVEDVVQEAFMKAVQTWKYNQLPDNPSAWLMRVAKNKALDILRREQHFRQYSSQQAGGSDGEPASSLEQFFLDHEIADSQLRMIFACCHPFLKPEDQVALTLQIVSGFSAAEIARALVTNEMTIQKRIYRAKQSLKFNNIQPEIPVGQELINRLGMVHTVLYLLFNEGYNSSKADELIRKDLCVEAMRLGFLLSVHPTIHQPATFALLSLMCFQASRFESRMDEQDSIILLQHQDRSKWDRDLINQGYHFLNTSSEGDELTVYHIESAIAAEHCVAATFEDTNWNRLLQMYDLLLHRKPTPVVALNRAIVLAQLHRGEEAVREILAIPDLDKLLKQHYIYSAVLGDCYLNLGDLTNANKYLQRAYSLTPSMAEKKLINEKIKKMSKNGLAH